MPIVKKFEDAEYIQINQDIQCKNLLRKDDLEDSRVTIDYYKISNKSQLDYLNKDSDISWIQILSGDVKFYDGNLNEDKIILLKGKGELQLRATQDTELVITKINNYKIFESDAFDNINTHTNIINWGNEPILKSEHDDRKRVYLLSELLAGTNSVKGELIIYPKNTSCPEHYHVGAQHYQLITEGEVVAVLDGKETILEKYDVLYNFENEPHWFYTKEKNCDFVEFFVPGQNKTIWTKTTNVCTWSPLGVDINGHAPSRHIEKHVHGEGKNI
jgi:quercetin dioxygenase-like cupin family protein